MPGYKPTQRLKLCSCICKDLHLKVPPTGLNSILFHHQHHQHRCRSTSSARLQHRHAGSLPSGRSQSVATKPEVVEAVVESSKWVEDRSSKGAGGGKKGKKEVVGKKRKKGKNVVAEETDEKEVPKGKEGVEEVAAEEIEMTEKEAAEAAKAAQMAEVMTTIEARKQAEEADAAERVETERKRQKELLRREECRTRNQRRMGQHLFEWIITTLYDCNGCPSVRILGEMAFQLERRILEYVFGAEGKSKRRFYGYTVSNICFMMAKESTTPCGQCDAIGRSDKGFRFQKLMACLHQYGYHVKVHPAFSQDVINRYGVLACPPDECAVQELRIQEQDYMSAMICKLSTSPAERACLNVLLACLCHLARCDGKPLFVW